MPVSQKTVIVRLAPHLDAKLTRLARKARVTRSDVIRRALDEITEDDSSALDAIVDLVGAANGPKDLSTNPKHMEGFGDDRRRRRPHRRAS